MNIKELLASKKFKLVVIAIIVQALAYLLDLPKETVEPAVQVIMVAIGAYGLQDVAKGLGNLKAVLPLVQAAIAKFVQAGKLDAKTGEEVMAVLSAILSRTPDATTLPPSPDATKA